jgi:hypothetical protein
MVPIFMGVWHMFWRGLTTAPPIISNNWSGVAFAVVVFCMNELNNVRRHGWPTTKRAWVGDMASSAGVVIVAWIGLAVLNSIYLVSEDHRNRVVENQILHNRVSQLESLNTELTKPRTSPSLHSPPKAVVPPPPDPSLMRVGAVFKMVSDIRATFLNRRTPVAFLVTTSADEAQFKGDLDAILLDSCNNGPRGHICTVEEVSGLTLPESKQQGVTVHIHEPEANPNVGIQPPFIQKFPEALSNWFTLYRGLDIPAAISDKLPGRFRDTTFVWIEVGPGLPWKGSGVRLQDGVGRAALDNLAPSTPLSQRLKEEADKAAAVQGQLRDPRTLSPPEQIRRGATLGILPPAVRNFRLSGSLQMIIAIRDARIAGVDKDETVNAEGIAIGGDGYQQFASLKNLLIKFSEDEAVKSK